MKVRDASTAIAGARKTLRYIKISLMSSMGPSTINAIWAGSGTRLERKEAATKASASLQRFNRTAKSIMINMEKPGVPITATNAWRGTRVWTTAAQNAPMTRKRPISRKSPAAWLTARPIFSAQSAGLPVSRISGAWVRPDSEETSL